MSDLQKPKLIIIEGAKGVGKSTLSSYIREKMPYTNLLRLSGGPMMDTSEAIRSSYDNLLIYLKNNARSYMNVVFDRMFFSEQVYCKLGHKNYSFDDDYYHLCNELRDLTDYYELTIIFLQADYNTFDMRLNSRGDKFNDYNINYQAKESICQQEVYTKLFAEYYGFDLDYFENKFLKYCTQFHKDGSEFITVNTDSEYKEFILKGLMK